MADKKNVIKTDEELRKEWNQINLDMFDYGRLINDNPLAYLGHLVTPQNQIGVFSTPLTADGFTQSLSVDKKSSDYPVISNAYKEAGLPEKQGSVLLGPAFTSTDKNANRSFVLTHELMHKGADALGTKKTNADFMDQEVLLRIIGALGGRKEDKTYLQNHTNVDVNKLNHAKPLMEQIQGFASGEIKLRQSKK